MNTNQHALRSVLFALLAVTAAIPAGLADEASVVLRKTPDWARTDSLWRSDAYLYDSAGNVKQIGTDKYRYDAAGRLIYATAATETEPGNSQDFVYDIYGNITKITTRTAPAPVLPSSIYGYGASSATNQLTGTCPAGVVHCFKGIYDEAGNLTGSINNGISNPGEYVWDALGTLTDLQGSRRERYIYDASEERIGVIRYEGEIEVERRYTLRGADNRVAREISLNTVTGAWTLTKDYVYRGGTLLAAYSGNTATTPDRHYHADHLGSTRLVTDAAGYKLAFHTYLPFGGEAAGSELDGERLKFTGHERDSNATYTGWDLDYMHARYYSPVTARFLSVDQGKPRPPDPQTWNRYTYTANSPTGRVDPDGFDWYAVLIYGYNKKTGMLFRAEHEAIVWIDPRGFGMTYERPAGKSFGEYTDSYSGSFANTKIPGRYYIAAKFRNLGPTYDPAAARKGTWIGPEAFYDKGIIQCTNYVACLTGEKSRFNSRGTVSPDLVDRMNDPRYVMGRLIDGVYWPQDMADGVGGAYIEVTASTSRVSYPDSHLFARPIPSDGSTAAYYYNGFRWD